MNCSTMLLLERDNSWAFNEVDWWEMRPCCCNQVRYKDIFESTASGFPAVSGVSLVDDWEPITTFEVELVAMACAETNDFSLSLQVNRFTPFVFGHNLFLCVLDLCVFSRLIQKTPSVYSSRLVTLPSHGVVGKEIEKYFQTSNAAIFQV